MIWQPEFDQHETQKKPEKLGFFTNFNNFILGGLAGFHFERSR